MFKGWCGTPQAQPANTMLVVVLSTQLEVFPHSIIGILVGNAVAPASATKTNLLNLFASYQ